MIFFCIPGPDDQNRWNRKNCPKFFHRVIFAFWIQICNPNLLPEIPYFFELQLILRYDLFLHTRTWWPRNSFKILNSNLQPKFMMKPKSEKNCPKFFHRVIFAFWIQICNPNLCKSIFFEITANIEMWSFFAYKNYEIGKIARNSFIG